MEAAKLKELNEKIYSLASTLDAVIDDYFTEESGEDLIHIRKNLESAWANMDEALDTIHFETNNKEDEEKPKENISDIMLRTMLKNLTPETAQKNFEIYQEIINKVKNVDELKEDLKGTFAVLLLIEYGKLAGKEIE